MDTDLAALVERTEKANQALVRGDVDTYAALTGHAPDYTLLAPFGGAATRGFPPPGEERAAIGRFFRVGTLAQELVATYRSGDLAVLVTLERVHVAVGGLPEQDWTLRVTQVFRLEAAGWVLAHRHADPLAHTLGLEQAAALARGEPR